jgi:hypothetical protein
MSAGEPLSIDSIEVEAIGRPREADVLFASIRRKLGRISMGEELVCENCVESEAGVEPVHPPVLSARWGSEKFIEGTDIQTTVVRQLSDPHILGEWAVDLEAEPLGDGSPTIDHFDVNGARITVERHALDKIASGYYEGIMEGVIVYSSELAVADMYRLRTLEEALPDVG